MNEENENYWRHLGSYVARKFCVPWRHPTYLFYLFVAIVGAGGLGIWSVLYNGGDNEKIVASLYTYFPAVAMASAFELILPKSNEKYVRSFALFVLFILALVAFVIGANPAKPYSLYLGIFGAGGAIALWWLANAENENLHDSPELESKAAIGGDVGKPVVGDTNDFTT